MTSNRANTEQKEKVVLLGDGHVHVHHCFDLDLFWQSAWSNFAEAANQYSQGTKFKAVLFLTECQGIDRFSDFKKEALSAEQQGLWSFQKTDESRCLRVCNDSGGELLLVAGRQIITAEKLEVLGLGVEEHYSDGGPLLDVLEWVLSKDGLAVVPWAVGKWMGFRGKCVKELVDNAKSKGIFLGDNGNRPFFWPLSSLFVQGHKNGIGNIPGSDPLPFGGEERRPGSYGFLLPEFQYQEEPIKFFFKSLKNNEQAICPYGKNESLIRFFKNQFSMQFIKRSR